MYSPKLNEKQLRELYRLSRVKEIPMTELVREAVDLYLKKQGAGHITPLASRPLKQGLRALNQGEK